MSTARLSRYQVLATGFSLTELLVVLAIIVVIVSILLPTINAARQQAMTVQCASNIKQVCTALQNYAAENKGLFPPNNHYDSSAPATANWYDVDRIGHYLHGTLINPALPSGYAQLGGPVFTCPQDDRSLRSYAMNVWVSCVTDSTTFNTPIAQGALWRGSGCRMTSSVILVAERWSTAGTATTSYYAPATLGGLGAKPGLRFGVGTGVSYNNTHWKPNPISELPYMWHRRHGDGGSGGTQSYGRVNIGFIDCHVVTETVGDLADRSTGLSTMNVLWSPLDAQQNN